MSEHSLVFNRQQNTFTRRQVLSALYPALPLAVGMGRRLPDADDEGRPNVTRLSIEGSILEVTITPGALDLSREQIFQWIVKAGSAIASYYGRFPVDLARITVHPAEGKAGVSHGTTWSSDPPFTRISVGQHATQNVLDRDWMMTHELVHMTFPDVAEEHHWIEEGIATYVEPIARTFIGAVTPAMIWSDMLESMHLGEPGPGDEGLDRTHTWGRTYWGGALFCLLADVRIRQATGNGKGLRDGLRAILQAGGSITQHWPVEKAFEIADHALGVKTLTTMYEQMKERPVQVDVDALWKQLGISNLSGAIVFEEDAPLSAIRRAITAPPK